MIDKFLDWYIKDEKNPLKLYVATCLAMVVLITVWWITCSSMEASAFNRITGSEVTTWDAMWVQLRVDRPTTN